MGWFGKLGRLGWFGRFGRLGWLGGWGGWSLAACETAGGRLEFCGGEGGVAAAALGVAAAAAASAVGGGVGSGGGWLGGGWLVARAAAALRGRRRRCVAAAARVAGRCRSLARSRSLAPRSLSDLLDFPPQQKCALRVFAFSRFGVLARVGGPGS